MKKIKLFESFLFEADHQNIKDENDPAYQNYLLFRRLLRSKASLDEIKRYIDSLDPSKYDKAYMLPAWATEVGREDVIRYLEEIGIHNEKTKELSKKWKEHSIKAGAKFVPKKAPSVDWIDLIKYLFDKGTFIDKNQAHDWILDNAKLSHEQHEDIKKYIDSL